MGDGGGGWWGMRNLIRYGGWGMGDGGFLPNLAGFLKSGFYKEVHRGALEEVQEPD